MPSRAIILLATLASACSASAADEPTNNVAAQSYPPPRVIMLNSDQPDDGITSAAEAERAIAASSNASRIIAEGGSALQPVGTPTAPPPLPRRQLTPEEEFAATCQRNLEQRIPELERRYSIIIQRGIARVARSTWDRMDRYERANLHWPLAYSASCPLGRRGDHRVRMVDENGRELAFQMISTRLECHGDHSSIRPEDTEYLC